MKYLLAAMAAVFIYCLTMMIVGRQKGKEERQLRKRLNEIKRMRKYDRGSDKEEKKGQRLDLSWIKIPAGIERDLKTSGIKVTSQEFMAVWMMAVFFPPILLMMLGMNFLICMGASLVGGIMPVLIVKLTKKKRVTKFQNQLGEALLIISSTIRAGITFERAMLTVADGLPEPICEELLQAGNEIKIGTPVETAMEAMAERMQNEDLRLVTSAVLIQKRVGGNLADILDNISETVKDRITIQRNIKTLTSQGRMSAQVIGALPILLVFILSFITPGYMEPLFKTSMGHMMMIVAITMEVIGFAIMLKMTDIKV